jgi:diaminopimelate decarboxylase
MKKRDFALLEKYESPLYVYDAGIIESNYYRFLKAFDIPNLQVYYACKALTNQSVLKLFKMLGSRLDCVSIEEVKLGLMAGFSPEEILFTPNCIAESEYEEAIDLGVKINVDNLPILEYLGMKYPGISLWIRINPHLMAGGNRKISVGHIDSKFGISIHQIPLLIRLVKNLKINVEGIHTHTGSDIIDPDIFIRAAKLIFSVVREFDSVKYIDFGSGFKIKYREQDLATDIEEFGEKFSRVFKEFCQEQGKEYTLCFEPGKYFVSDAGYFLTRVNLIKQTTACIFVGIDSGFNHFIRPMFYDSHHEMENISNPDGEKKVYSIVGYICETDTFGTDRILNEVRKGDVLKFKNAGAYCFSMASNYNSRVRPAEVLIYKGKPHLIRKRESIESLVQDQVDIEI